MKLPNGGQAIVEHTKLLGYVLNPDHPVGKHHAFLFERLIGVIRENSAILKQALLDAAAHRDVESSSSNEHGVKYRIRSQVVGPLGSKEVISVWVNAGSAAPRLVTCFVD